MKGLKAPLSLLFLLSAATNVARGQYTRLPDCPITENDKFPDDFVFGSASSAYQIEGAWDTDGKGPSIWDVGVHDYPERITDRSNGDVAADSYHKYEEDIQAMVDTGFKVYRFSIAWARIMPSGGRHTLNQAGIDYYNRLIDALIAKNITPAVTMFHWDLPQPVQDYGGFMNPLFSTFFLDYADILFEKFGDRVRDWITFNEPIEICDPGYAWGAKPPFIRAEQNGAEYLCAYNLVIAHAQTYRMYYEKYHKEQQGRIGIALSIGFNYPLDGQDWETADRTQQYGQGIFAHPLYKGNWPPNVIEEVNRNSKEENRTRSRLPEFTPEMVEYMKGANDFIGVNYYTSFLVSYNEDYRNSPPSKGKDQAVWGIRSDSWLRAISDWLNVVPEGFRDAIHWFSEQYDYPEIVITENGYSDGGELKDLGRIMYLREHIKAVLKAIKCDGSKVTAYYAWSIIDNFEWMVGYTERFGIYHVDFEDPDRPRTPKESAFFLKDVIANNRVPDKCL